MLSHTCKRDVNSYNDEVLFVSFVFKVTRAAGVKSEKSNLGCIIRVKSHLKNVLNDFRVKHL